MNDPDLDPAVVVCDAGPIIHLDELDSVELLSMFAEVLIPDAVWTEVDRHRPAALHRGAPSWRRVSVNLPEPQTVALARALSLGAGEVEAISVARAHPQATLLTDDAAARLAAVSHVSRVPVVSSVAPPPDVVVVAAVLPPPATVIG